MAVEFRSLVPMAFVKSVARSIAFYEKLGFRVGNSVRDPEDAEPRWAWLVSSGAQLMIARASEPVVAEQQAILFYVYCDDVQAAHAALKTAGVEMSPIEYPFWSPRGEFRITDPDGYVLIIAHT